MGDTARARVTSFVQSQGPAANATDVVVTREVVTFKREHIAPATLTDPRALVESLHRVQENVEQATASARSLPVLGGAYHPDLAFANGVAQTLPHRLEGEVSWLPCRLRSSNASAQIVETSQDSANNRITLVTNADVTVDLWFFPAPKASR